MEKKNPLFVMGDRIKEIRKREKMNQIEFYKKLYPDKDLEDENIKKKMNAIENGKMKRIDIELLFRLHEVFDVSIDYLLGYETEYPSYENEAASKYTGLSSDAVYQLSFWNKYKNKKVSELPIKASDKEFIEYHTEIVRKNEANWILDITNKLLEMKDDTDEKDRIADLSILYDLYMMTLSPPKTVKGITEEIADSDRSLAEKAVNSVKIASEMMFFTDEMGEVHHIDMGAINQQLWKERLLRDVELFVNEIRKKRKEHSTAEDYKNM